jgi:hypothetical protein
MREGGGGGEVEAEEKEEGEEGRRRWGWRARRRCRQKSRTDSVYASRVPRGVVCFLAHFFKCTLVKGYPNVHV